MISKFNSRAGNTVALIVENDRLQATRARALKMVDTVACLIARVINFFLIDIVKEVQA